MTNNKITNNKMIKDSINNAPENAKNCLEYCISKMEHEEQSGGEFKSIDDFIDRMLNAGLDIHAFSIISEYLPITFPGNGNASMLRVVIALRGWDPDYTELPQIDVYSKYASNNEEDDDDDELLPFI